MADEGKYYVGQKVYLFSDRIARQEVEVVRVGRTLVYIKQYGRERKFKIDTGYESGTVRGAPDHIMTAEEMYESDRRSGARLRLKELGIYPPGFEYGRDYKYSTDVLLEMIKLLEREEQKA